MSCFVDNVYILVLNGQAEKLNVDLDFLSFHFCNREVLDIFFFKTAYMYVKQNKFAYKWHEVRFVGWMSMPRISPLSTAFASTKSEMSHASIKTKCYCKIYLPYYQGHFQRIIIDMYYPSDIWKHPHFPLLTMRAGVSRCLPQCVLCTCCTRHRARDKIGVISCRSVCREITLNWILFLRSKYHEYSKWD